MNIRSDMQIDKEILRTLARYQRLVAGMAKPVHIVMLLLPPMVVMNYEELSRSPQESDNSDCVDIAAMISRHAIFESTISSLVAAHKQDIAALHSRKTHSTAVEGIFWALFTPPKAYAVRSSSSCEHHQDGIECAQPLQSHQCLRSGCKRHLTGSRG
ncbi:hypothetical protein ACEV6Q_06950 [Enterobacter ludwigii]|uniref:hypothetical protein n=1 Tax=Enterobacter ludwigii TaxID=299767 RepID=UPI003BEF2232